MIMDETTRQVLDSIIYRLKEIEDQQEVFREILSRGTNLKEPLPPHMRLNIPQKPQE